MVKCPNCGSAKYIKKGSDRKGKQRVKCTECGRGYSINVYVDTATTAESVHYSLAPEFCPAAKRAISPLFTNKIDDVTCRTCRSRYNRQIKPNKLTSVKSFTLTGDAIDLLVSASKTEGKSQSALINELIMEYLTDEDS